MSSASFVHPTAHVEDGAQIGQGTTAWHNVQVRATAKIGAGCVLGKNVYVDSDVVIGDGVHIQNNVSVYRGVTLEDKVFVGPSAVFTNDLYPRAGNDDFVLVPTIVRQGASIGANATIVCGIEIGRAAMVAAGAVVANDVADHELVAGNPARRIGWVCKAGHVAARTTDELESGTCPECGELWP